MIYKRQHPLLDLGKGLRERLDGEPDDPSERMQELLERMAGLPAPRQGSMGGESRPRNDGSGA